MGSIAVVWAGKYGTAERYAGWLRQALGAQVLPASSLQNEALVPFATVILVGAVVAGRIRGLSKLKKSTGALQGKRLYVLAVGISPAAPGVVDALRTANLQGAFGQAPLFYARGAWNMAAMRSMDRALCGLLLRMMRGRAPDKLDDMGRAIVEVGMGPKDYTDKEYLLPLIDRVIKDRAGEGENA